MNLDKTLKGQTDKGRPPQTASYRRKKQSEREKKANKEADAQASVIEKSSNMAQEEIGKCSKDKEQETANAMQQIGTISMEIAQQVSDFLGSHVAEVAEVSTVQNVIPNLDFPVIECQEAPTNEVQGSNEVQGTTEVEVHAEVLGSVPAPAEVQAPAEVLGSVPPAPDVVEVNVEVQAPVVEKEKAPAVEKEKAPVVETENIDGSKDTVKEHGGGNNNDDDEGEEEGDDDEGEEEGDDDEGEEEGEYEDDEGEEEGEDDSDEEDDENDKIREEVKLDFTKSKLYRSFKCHVAYLLLRRKNIQDRGVLGCKQCTKKLMEWDLAKEHESVRKLVEGSPLYCLAKCLYKSCDKVLISGFVERWHAETNTFHSSFGEITVTLDDVQKIIGLPIRGHGVTGVETSSIPGEKFEVFLRRMFGISLKKIREEFQGSTCNNIKLEFLRLNLAGNSLERCTAEQVARGYLLYLLGCTLFQDKTGDKVSLKYLYYLENLNEIGKWSWGAAGLAHLYRELGKASRHGTKTISGYLTLLQAWVYEHFPTLRPHKSIEMTKGMTRTDQWTPRSHYNARDANSLLKSLRIHLDNLTKTDVVLTPYRKVAESPDEVAWYTGVLMVDDIIEPYQPDRVVRQFGHVQDTPRDPLAPKRVRKSGTKAASYTPRFDGRTDEFERWSDHVMNPNNRGPRMKTKGECTVSYANWVRENLICRLEYSVKDPLAPEMEDETKFAAWKVLDSVSSKSIKHELLVAIDKAKALLKPELPDSEARQDAGTSKSNTSGAKKRKRN